MTILASTSSVLRVVAGAAVSAIDVQVSWVDMASGAYTPGSTETEITTATTTTVVAAPGAATYRKIRGVILRNTSLTSCQVTVQHYNGTLAADLFGVTLQEGEVLTRTSEGGWLHLTNTGAPYVYTRPQAGFLGISGSKAETIPRHLFAEGSVSALTNGQLMLFAIYLVRGTVVSSISFCSGGTPAGTPTNQFFALYALHGGRCAQSANDTTTAWAANTIKTLNMTSPYTIPVSGVYYVGIMVTATTMPTLKGISTSTATSLARYILPGRAASTASLTTVMPDPAINQTTVNTGVAWGCVS